MAAVKSPGAVEVTERREFAAIIKRVREDWPVVVGYWSEVDTVDRQKQPPPTETL